MAQVGSTWKERPLIVRISFPLEVREMGKKSWWDIFTVERMMEKQTVHHGNC